MSLLESAGWSENRAEKCSDPMRMGSDPEDVVAFMLSEEMGHRLVEGKDPEAVQCRAKATLEALRARRRFGFERRVAHAGTSRSGPTPHNA
jgi:hypothetical protein